MTNINIARQINKLSEVLPAPGIETGTRCMTFSTNALYSIIPYFSHCLTQASGMLSCATGRTQSPCQDQLLQTDHHPLPRDQCPWQIHQGTLGFKLVLQLSLIVANPAERCASSIPSSLRFTNWAETRAPTQQRRVWSQKLLLTTKVPTTKTLSTFVTTVLRFSDSWIKVA